MKILLIEDHDAFARLSCEMLREVLGHDVVHARTGKGALGAVLVFTPEVVVIDMNLPDTNGYRLAEALRRRPGLDDAVFVALTAAGQLVDAEEAARVGIDVCYRKPMDFGELPRLVQKRRGRRSKVTVWGSMAHFWRVSWPRRPDSRAPTLRPGADVARCAPSCSSPNLDSTTPCCAPSAARATRPRRRFS